MCNCISGMEGGDTGDAGSSNMVSGDQCTVLQGANCG
jgi:hypothetical protein